MNKSQLDNYEQQCDSALEWIARLRSDAASAQDCEAFALWLAGDPIRRQAMDDMLELWDDLGSVKHLPDFDLDNQTGPTAANDSRWNWAWAGLAATILLTVLMLPLLQVEDNSQRYATELGEQRSVELADGSVVLLNTDTRMRVSLNDDERLVELKSGEAHFSVAPDAQRPFHVDVGSARITAIGTAFNIYRHEESADITVSEGVVRVTELGDTGNRAAATEVLRANQALSANPGGLGETSIVDVSRQLAWRRGEIIAEGMPLPELIAQIERYHATSILLGDSEVAAMTVSGVFQLQRPEAILRALEVTLGLETRQIDEQTVQLLKTQR